MVMTAEGKHRATMMNIKEIEDLLKFAKENFTKTKDDRIILINKETGIISTHYVGNVDQYFSAIREEQIGRLKGNFDDQNIIDKVPSFMIEITDWNSA